MKHSSSLALLSAAALFLNISVAHAQFTDVKTSRDDAEAVAYVFSRGIVSGYSDGTFRPDGTINRAEFAKIASLFYWNGEKKYIEMCGSKHFDDVALDAWYFHFVCTAKDHEIVSGYPGTRLYKPEQSITVAEAAKMIIAAFKIQTTATNGAWYAPYIHALADRNALPTSLTSLDQPIRRGQVADIFYRLDTKNENEASLSYADLTGEEVSNEHPCTAGKVETASGRSHNPIDPIYENFPWLGPLFTASDCGSERLEDLYGDQTGTISDLKIFLKRKPSSALYNVLYGIGFAPTDGTNSAESTKWTLTSPATYRELLQLKNYVQEMQGDDCEFCG